MWRGERQLLRGVPGDGHCLGRQTVRAGGSGRGRDGLGDGVPLTCSRAKAETTEHPWQEGVGALRARTLCVGGEESRHEEWSHEIKPCLPRGPLRLNTGPDRRPPLSGFPQALLAPCLPHLPGPGGPELPELQSLLPSWFRTPCLWPGL